MINAIMILVLIVVATRVYNIYKNGGKTDIYTEVLQGGSQLICSLAVFIILMIMAQ